MNNKLLTKVLANSGYTNAEQIAEIINATPNPNVALEMLLGVYTPTKRPMHYKRGNTYYVVESFNDLHNNVNYVEYTRKRKQVWAVTKEDWDNKVFVDERPKAYHDYTYVDDSGYKTQEGHNSLSEFLDRNEELDATNFWLAINAWENNNEPVQL